MRQAGSVTKAFAAKGLLDGHPYGWIGTGDDPVAALAARPESGDDKLVIPRGAHQLAESFEINLTGDKDIGLHVQGSGRRGTTLLRSAGTVAAFLNSTMNLRGLVMDDLTLRGDIGLHLQRAQYNLFRNVAFTFCDDAGFLDDTSGFNTFQNCWWVHNEGDSIRASGSAGRTHVIDSIIGEDTGAIVLGSSSYLTIRASILHQPKNKLDANGYGDVGNNVFTVTVGAGLDLLGCYYRPSGSVENVITANGARTCRITNNPGLDCGAATFLRILDAQMHDDKFYPWIITGNTFIFGDGGLFYEADTDAASIKNSVIRDNVFIVPVGYTATFDASLDRLRTAGHNNVVADNTIIEL